LPHARLETTALDHEAVDHPMKYRVVVMPVLDVLQEVLDGLRRLLLVELDRDDAVIRMQFNHLDTRGLFGDRRSSRPECVRNAQSCRQCSGIAELRNRPGSRRSRLKRRPSRRADARAASTAER